MQKTELQQRKAVMQTKLQMLDLDGALLAQNVSMYYFSGTMQCQYVFIPSEGECLGLVRKNIDRAEREAGISVVALDGFSELPARLKEAGFSPKHLGVEMDVLPAKIYFRLVKALPGIDFSDASNAVREARQVKSEYELQQFYAAARQVDALHKRVPELLRAGREELEFAADCEAILRKAGYQGFGRMHGFNSEMFFGHILSGPEGAEASFVDSPTGGKGLSPAMPYSAGHKKIAPHEPVTVDYAGIHNGYVVDMTRLYSLGTLPDLLVRGFDAALHVQETVKALLTPGITGAEIYDASFAAAKKHGLSEHFMGVGRTQVPFVGHGVGLEFDEFPILAKNSPHRLEENNVVAVEPKFTFPGLGVVGLENTWHVTKSGAVKISLTPDEHVIL